MKLFVYGTLKRGYLNDISRDATFVQTIKTASRYELKNLGEYPGMTHGTSSVKGELFDITLRNLWKLDVFEECPTLFLRKTVELEDGTFAEAYFIVPQHIKDAKTIQSW